MRRRAYAGGGREKRPQPAHVHRRGREREWPLVDRALPREGEERKPQSRMAKSNRPIRIPYLVYERCRSATNMRARVAEEQEMNSRAVIYYISQREMQGSVCDALLYGVCRPAPPGARGSGVQRCTDGGRDGGRGATAHCDTLQCATAGERARR